MSYTWIYASLCTLAEDFLTMDFCIFNIALMLNTLLISILDIPTYFFVHPSLFVNSSIPVSTEVDRSSSWDNHPSKHQTLSYM